MTWYCAGDGPGLYNDLKNIPEELKDSYVEISDDHYLAVINAASEGKVIVKDEDGYPQIVDRPGPSKQELAAVVKNDQMQLLAYAALKIAPLQDAVDLDDATAEEEALLKKWKQYRVALNRIDQQANYPTKVEWPAAPDA